MSIQLFPCGHVPCPCPDYSCDSFDDLTKPEDNYRVVVVRVPAGGSPVSGALTYVPAGGSTTVVVLTVVTSAQKLCLGPNHSLSGPLLYTTAAAADASLVHIGYTYNSSGGGGSISVSAAVGPCVNGLQIVPNPGTINDSCPAAAVSSGSSCATCVENTQSSVFGGTGSLQLNDWNPGGVGIGTGWCSGTHTVTGSTSNLFAGISPATPLAIQRPCEWVNIAFNRTFAFSETISFGCGGSVVVSGSASIVKVAGQDFVTKTGTATFSGAPTPRDTAPWQSTHILMDKETATSYSMKCTTYTLRLRVRVLIYQYASGSWDNGVYIGGSVAATWELIPP